VVLSQQLNLACAQTLCGMRDFTKQNDFTLQAMLNLGKI